VLIACAVSIAACGEDAATGPRKVLFVVGTEMAFDAPASVPEGDYTVTFLNNGAVFHELAFKDPDGEFRARRTIAGGGQTITMDVTLTPGTWELGCFEPGHYEAGMHRELLVEPSG